MLKFFQVLAAVMHWHRSGPNRDDATAVGEPVDFVETLSKTISKRKTSSGNQQISSFLQKFSEMAKFSSETSRE